MSTYQIKEHEVELYQFKYLKYLFGDSKACIRRREERGILPPANYHNEKNWRLYSIEELAILEYVYKELWPYRKGYKTPDWIRNLLRDAFFLSKKLVLQYGRAQSADDWLELEKYKKFSRYRLQIYIDSWRARLLNEEPFFEELVDEEW